MFLRLFLDNFYFLVTIITAVYCFAFIFFLSSRFQYSTTSRRFAVFLVCVFAWSVKDSLGVVLVPYFNLQSYLRLTVALSALFLIVPPACLSIFISVLNASLKPEKRFDKTSQMQIALVAILAVVYICSLIEPSFMYKNFVLNGANYTFKPGPGIIIFFAIMILSALVPSISLLSTSWKKFNSESFLFGVGAIFSIAIVSITNIFAGMIGLTAIPRLGCISMGIFCVFAFYGIRKHGRAFSISEVLQERDKLRMIGQSLERLISAYNEDDIYQNISDYAREISDSAIVFIFFYETETDSVQIRAISRDSRLELEPDLKNLLEKGYTCSFEKSRMKALFVKKGPAAFESLYSLLPSGIDSTTALKLNKVAHVKQVVCYPVYQDEVIRV